MAKAFRQSLESFTLSGDPSSFRKFFPCQFELMSFVPQVQVVPSHSKGLLNRLPPWCMGPVPRRLSFWLCTPELSPEGHHQRHFHLPFLGGEPPFRRPLKRAFTDSKTCLLIAWRLGDIDPQRSLPLGPGQLQLAWFHQQ